METRSVLIVCTYVRTYCTCVNCIYSVHIYNFRERAYIAYIYNFFLHMGQRRLLLIWRAAQSVAFLAVCYSFHRPLHLKLLKVLPVLAVALSDCIRTISCPCAIASDRDRSLSVSITLTSIATHSFCAILNFTSS